MRQTTQQRFWVLAAGSALLAGTAAFAAVTSPVTSGLIGAYDATDVTLDAGGVASWNDQSGNGNHALQATDTKRPTVSAAVMPSGTSALAFNGAQFLEVAANPGDFDSAQWTWYAVFQTNDVTTSAQGRIVSAAYTDMDPGPGVVGNNTQWAMHPGGGGTAEQFRAATRVFNGSSLSFVAANTPVGSINDTGYFLGGGVWDNAGLDITSIIIDETNNRQTASAALANSNTTPQGHLFTRIGNGSSTTSVTEVNHFDGVIAELLLFNRALSLSEQAQVEAYLYNKHLVPVPEPTAASLVGLAVLPWLLRRRSR